MKNTLDIGNRIRKIRENMNLTRNSFSEIIDISETFLSQIERGEKCISLNTLLRICRKTGISADYILFGNNSFSISQINIIKILNQLPPEANNIVYNTACFLNNIYDKNKISKD